MLDHEGKEVAGSHGYKYFGAARDLPGVRELFESEAQPAPRKNRAELMKDVDSRYYGFLDDDDQRLVPQEIEAEKAAVASALEEWKRKKEAGQLGRRGRSREGKKRKTGGIVDPEDEVDSEEEETDEEEDIYATLGEKTVEEAMLEGKERRFTARVVIPTQKDIEEALLRRKKQEIAQQYALDEFDEEDNQNGVDPVEEPAAKKAKVEAVRQKVEKRDDEPME